MEFEVWLPIAHSQSKNVPEKVKGSPGKNLLYQSLVSQNGHRLLSHVSKTEKTEQNRLQMTENLCSLFRETRCHHQTLSFINKNCCLLLHTRARMEPKVLHDHFLPQHTEEK